MPAFLRRRSFWLVTAAVVILGGGGAFMMANANAKKEKAAAEAKKAPESPYAAIANGKADVEGGIIQVAARRQGIVSEVLVQEGATVAKGQILARQQDEDSILAVNRARADVAQSRAQIALLEVQLRTARREAQRLQNLSASNFVAGQRLDTARDAIASAEASLAAQRASIATAEAALRQAEFNLEMTNIRAPADGVIVRRYANPGAGASTLNVTPMFDLEPKSPRIIRAEIAEASVTGVFIGQPVEISLESDPTKVFTGKVIRRSAMFGARKLQSDDPSERTDERVVETVVTADGAPFLIGQRVLVKFMKPGQVAGAKRAAPPAETQQKS
ncbi:HlyD family secretion protein [Caulobacter sp. NIBR2454]|uniref:HlyD family secretion protein n=1 Tax=Caulobacter sp. NIBR2454 TaxID=3015996 RepID=UPI0022B6C184|nr:HlyD family efflux transporter periplasmic adaptor subunit [Caulobacter sp. NIBR2454]